MNKKEDKIVMLLKKYTEAQTIAIELIKMTNFRVRVVNGNSEFYGNLFIYKHLMTIEPDDKNLDVISFNEKRLVGYIEIGNKGIQLNLRLNKPCYQLFFLKTMYRDQALKCIRTLMRDESTDFSEDEMLSSPSV